MLKRIGTTFLTGLAILFIGASSQAQSTLTAKSRGLQPQPVRAAVESDRIKDGLIGPVRRVRTEIVKLATTDGKAVEGKRALLEIVAYDIRGNKVENQYFPVAGATLTGKEVYKYDDKGNISEMTLLNNDGSLVGKEAYKYEFDFAGNWNKMTTTVAVVESGKLSFEPTEVTYRSIMYYIDANLMKMAQPTAASAPVPSSSPSASGDLASKNLDARVVDSAASVKVEPVTRQKSATVPHPSDGANMNVMSSAELQDSSPNVDTHASAVLIASEPPSATPNPPSAAPNPYIATPNPILKAISGGVLNGTAILLPSPAYPDTARKMRTSGVVTVDVVIDEDGKVISAQASAGPTTLREAAAQAALRARFTPTKLSGQPVKVTGVIHYKFTLQ